MRFFVFLFIFITCNCLAQESLENKFQRIAKQEVKSGKRFNDTYLGFKLGMGSVELKQLCDSLRKTGVFKEFHHYGNNDPVWKNKYNCPLLFGYLHYFKLNTDTFMSFVQYDFYKDKLLELDIVIYDSLNRISCLDNLVNLYTKKFGTHTMGDSLRYSWIHGNRYMMISKIDFSHEWFSKLAKEDHCAGVFRITYIDLQLYFKKEKEAQNEQQKAEMKKKKEMKNRKSETVIDAPAVDSPQSD
jgi:hypothetical protein